MYSIGNLKDGVAGLLSGTNLDKVTGLYKVFERQARVLVQKADVPEASEKTPITLYSDLYTYPAPSRIFGGALVDIRPQGISRGFIDSVQKMPIEQFDRQKAYALRGYKVAFETEDGIPLIRIATAVPMPAVLIDGMSEDDWTIGGSLTALAEDRTVYYEQPGSLRFTLTGSSTGTLEKTLSSQLNLTNYEDVGVVFLAIRIPDGATASDLTSVGIRIGNSSTVYDSVTSTTGFLGAWTAGKWLVVALDMAASTSTGTPDWDNIDYVQIRLAHTGTFTNFRVGRLWIALPSPHEIIAQTSAIFLENGTRGLTITDDDTQIVLNDAAFNLYEHECALGVALQTKQSKQATALKAILYGEGNEPGLYTTYRGDNPSEEVRMVGSYYDT